jgi:hypothetical protein
MITTEDIQSVFAAWLAAAQDMPLMQVVAGLLLVFQFYVGWKRLQLIKKEEEKHDKKDRGNRRKTR